MVESQQASGGLLVGFGIILLILFVLFPVFTIWLLWVALIVIIVGGLVSLVTGRKFIRGEKSVKTQEATGASLAAFGIIFLFIFLISPKLTILILFLAIIVMIVGGFVTSLKGGSSS
jgi:hypothetical protein